MASSSRDVASASSLRIATISFATFCGNIHNCKSDSRGFVVVVVAVDDEEGCLEFDDDDVTARSASSCALRITTPKSIVSPSCTRCSALTRDSTCLSSSSLLSSLSSSSLLLLVALVPRDDASSSARRESVGHQVSRREPPVAPLPVAVVVIAPALLLLVVMLLFDVRIRLRTEPAALNNLNRVSKKKK